MNKYNPKDIEPKWQKFWEKKKTFVVREDKKNPSTSLRARKFYGLIEFPYPSGAGLHVGHPRSYTAMDVVSRKRRMQGYNVLYPIGFDAFGLPTENYAIKTGRPPEDVTAENVATFTRQLKELGFSFDWSRTVNTTDPEYYKWTQWIFLQLFKHGLAYKKNQPINWCPKDKIGLANEEVVDGKCERCGTPVEKREKEQWMLAITKYADKLLEGLKDVDYIERAKTQQSNWIGRSEGAEIQFRLRRIPGQEDNKHSLTVFTTRPDTIFGATFVAISPELAKKWLNIGWQAPEKVKKYIEEALKERLQGGREEKEKTGIDAGFVAVNPVNNEEIPVWVANYVMGETGTGAIMVVPAHDERDFEFAKKYKIKSRIVVIPNSERDISAITVYPHYLMITEHLPGEADWQASLRRKKELFEQLKSLKDFTICFSGEGTSVNSDFLNDLPTPEAKEKMIAWLEEKEIGKRQVNYKLRDWVFSRQRYWGEPIPLVFCENCAGRNKEQKTRNKLSEGELLNQGWVPMSEDELPLKLPKVEKYQPTDTGESPLAAMTDWVNTKCPRCGGPARRETDTMPNWAGSSWYFLRYTDPNNKKEFASMEKLRYWMSEPKLSPPARGGALAESADEAGWGGGSGVDWYNGGMEHTVLHLLYSRFWHQFLYDIGKVPTREPYAKRTSHGLILGPDGEKMSKSRGNVVNPDDMVKEYGADALRTYILFMGPFDQPVAWDTNGLVGVRRFLDRVWALQSKVTENTESTKTQKAQKHENTLLTTMLHQTIKKVTEDIEEMRFNTAIAKMMELTNEMTKQDHVACSMYHVALKLLSPFAPHICEELWSITGGKGSIAFASWPEYDPKLIQETIMTIAVQVNGKLRDTFDVPADATEEAVKQQALKSAKVQKWLDGKEPKKVIYVKGKLVSIVV